MKRCGKHYATQKMITNYVESHWKEILSNKFYLDFWTQIQSVNDSQLSWEVKWSNDYWHLFLFLLIKKSTCNYVIFTFSTGLIHATNKTNKKEKKKKTKDTMKIRSMNVKFCLLVHYQNKACKLHFIYMFKFQNLY